MKKILLLSVISLVLVGCKVDITAVVNSDELLLDEHTTVGGVLDVEILACTEENTSNTESESLIEAKKTISSIFNGVKYSECNVEGDTSIASFVIPIGVGSIRKEGGYTVNEGTDIYIASDDDIYLGVFMQEETLKKIESANEKLQTNLNMNFSILLEKGEQPIPDVFVIAAYINDDEGVDIPAPILPLEFESENVLLKLSNVSNSVITSGELVPVLITKNLLKEMIGE